MEGEDAAGDVAAVERVARRLQPGDPAAARRGPLLVGEELQGRREVGLHEFLARLRRPAVRQVDFDRRRKAADRVRVVADEIGHVRIDRKTLAGDADRRRRDLGEGHRAVFFERGNPRVGRRRHHRALDSDRDLAAVVLLKIFGARLFRPAAEAADRHRLAALGEPDEDRGHPADADMDALEDAGRDPGRDPGIDRVAAGLEHLQTGLRRHVMPGRDRMGDAHHAGAIGILDVHDTILCRKGCSGRL